MPRRLVGVVSDTHDNKWAFEAIVKRFSDEAVLHVLHAGDFVAPFNARHLSNLNCPFTSVFGNNDGERIGLLKTFGALGTITVGPYALAVEERRLLVMHEPAALEALGASGMFDAVIYGHTHGVEVRAVPWASGNGHTLILNPGEACGWMNDHATAALLDLDTMQADIFEVPAHP
jgi:hypothetical protein